MSYPTPSRRPDGPELGTGQLLALAATASGGIAWLIQRAISRSDEVETKPAPVNLRTHLHALVESDAVRNIERRSNELAPVVADYRTRAGKAVERANRERNRRLTEAEKIIAQRRKESTKALQGLEREVGRQVDRTRHIIDDAPGRLSAAVDDRRQELRQLEKIAAQRAADLRQATSTRTGEATIMANENFRRLQERGAEAAGAISATLRDGSKDTTGRVIDVRDQVVSLAKTSSKDVGALLGDVREDARKNLPVVAKTVGDRATGLGQQVAGTAGPTIGKLGERIGSLTEDVKTNPRAVRARVAEQGQALIRSAQDQARTARELVPLTGKGSAASADDTDVARQRGLDLAGLLQSNIPSFLAQVTDMIEQAGDASGKRAQDGRRQGAKVSAEAESQLQSTLDRLGEAARRAAQVGDQAVAASSHLRGASRNAAHKTADAGKDGLESIIWLGAAGVAMYYGVLTPEQRAKVSKVGVQVGRGLGKVITEVRGRDQKF